MSEVLIVGAGPVGLTLAIGMRRRGVEVRVVDKAALGPGRPKAAVLWPRAQVIMEELGALPAFEATGVPIRRTTVWAGRRRLGSLTFGRTGAHGRTPLAIEQHDTERLLRAHFAALGGVVEQGTEATGLRVGDDEVRVDLRGPAGAECVRPRWLVGCDGAHSFVRGAAGIRFPGGPRRNLQVLQIDAVPRWKRPLDSDGGAVVLAPGVSISLYPMPGGHHRIFAFAVDPAPRRDEPPTVADMRALIAASADAPELTLTAAGPGWLNRARFQDRRAEVFRKGRVLLCGDAAHVWAPVGGHGMNVGLYGADNLARSLAAVLRGGADERRLDAYAAQQRRLATLVARATRFDLLEQPPSPRRLALLRAVLPAALAWPGFSAGVDAALGDLKLGPALTGRARLTD